MLILIDLQPLQTPTAANRGIGRYTNGLLSALASSHQVVGMRRAVPYLVPPTVSVPTIEIRPGLSETEIERLISDHHFDVVINCSGPYWDENVIVSGLRDTNRPIVSSIFYDVIPWVFPDVYLQDPKVRQSYHNRCVDLYARADLVCAVSQHSERDALRFGYATHETATTISLGVERIAPEVTNAREKWKIPGSYLLSVSSDEFQENPGMLIAAFLQSRIRKSRCLVVIISNDADSGFSSRMEAKYGNLRAQGVIILPEVSESELDALYRDCDAFVFTSLYEGFGIPIVEVMQFGKWIVSSRSSSLAEVSGPALLSLIQDPSNLDSIMLALDQAGKRLDEGPLDESIPRSHARKFSWTQVVRNFENAVVQRRKVMVVKPSTQTPERPRLFWAGPFPTDVSGIAFYSEDLVGPVSQYYDIILVPNTVSTFVPTPKTGRFKIVEAHAEALLALTNGEQPLVFYNIGNSHFHLELLDLLFKIPGIVLLHDSFIKGLEEIWRDRIAGRARAEGQSRFDDRPLDVQIIESSRVMLFLGEHAKSLIASEHLAKRPAHVVPLYCRYRGAISAMKRAELRRKYGIPENTLVVTTTGFQTRMKLTDQIIQSCIELQRREEGAQVYVQVLGHFFDAALEAEVRALLTENGVRAFVSEGFVDEETLAERVALSDVAVFLRGWTTGGPSAGLNDALGMGIASLVTDDFGLREYPTTAVLRVANSEVTEGLILLYRHPEVRQALAAGGLQYAQDMSPERIATRLCEVLSLYEQERASYLEAERETFAREAGSLRGMLEETRRDAETLRERMGRAEAERETFAREADGLRGRIAEESQAVAELHRTVDEMYKSLSMRITAPLRVFKRRFPLAVHVSRSAWSCLMRMPGQALRPLGRRAANRPALRRLARRLLMGWPRLHWRIKQFLFVTPEASGLKSPAESFGPPLVLSNSLTLHVSPADQAPGEYHSEDGVSQFAVIESMHAVVDVEALRKRIRSKTEHRQG